MIMKSRHIWHPLSWFYKDRHRDDSTPVTPSWLDRFNDRLAIRMTIIFGSIWCVYAFMLFSLLPVFKPEWQGGLLYVSNSIQLVALPALMVGSAILARGNDQRAAEDHAALIEILSDVREEVGRLRAMTANIAQQETQNNERPTDLVSISDNAVISVNEPETPANGGTRAGA
ncbi:hypothetical protein LWC05_02700 [Acetobacter sicerae]|uniref:DUF1003 domain-containing protein n=1 Tax=Acetobacter sicerae TaxID=85325 RepID=A0ABS8VQ64_9PROT|nr:hypothetical protein [Acetobacter sicerae]MCE0742808.1 hypothetical protein [Acetobacter sicerae]NHN90459.1 hypothetical protein [Acetobacter sicerae]